MQTRHREKETLEWDAEFDPHPDTELSLLQLTWGGSEERNLELYFYAEFFCE